MSIISNTTVLSNLAAVNELELLHQLYQRLYMPTAVYDEIRRGLDEGYAFYNALIGHVYPLNDNGWIHLTSVSGEAELRALGRLPRKIHSGEAECLAIAKQRQWLLLTDDRAAREAARAWGIPLSGTPCYSVVRAVMRRARKLITPSCRCPTPSIRSGRVARMVERRQGNGKIGNGGERGCRGAGVQRRRGAEVIR